MSSEPSPDFGARVSEEVRENSEAFRWREETLCSFGGTFRVVEAEPHPDRLKSDVPVLVAPGFSEDYQVLERPIAELVHSGRKVISFEHPRWGGIAPPDSGESKLLLRKSLTLLSILEQKGVSQADVVAHSEGALHAVRAAQLAPERFRNLVLVNPAGLTGETTFPRLAGRLGRKTAHGARRAVKDRSARTDFVRAQVRGGWFMAKNPSKAVGEARAITKTRIDGDLTGLQESGILVAVIQSNQDRMFRPEEMEQYVPSECDSYASVNSETAAHDEFFFNPELAAGGVAELLDQLEAWSEKPAPPSHLEPATSEFRRKRLFRR